MSSAQLTADLKSREEDDEAHRQARATNEASQNLVREHLEVYLEQNPEGTYEAWIASLHPENVTLDSRLLTANNPWITFWREATEDVRCCSCRNLRRGRSSSFHRSRSLVDLRGRRPPAGWGGLVDVTLGIAFVSIAFIAGVVFESIRGIFLGFARLCNEGLRILLLRDAERVGLPVATLLLVPACLLWLLQGLFWLVAVIVLIISVVILEVLAAVAATVCGFLSLSPTQGIWTHSFTRKMTFVTLRTMRRLFAQCGILHWYAVARDHIDEVTEESPTFCTRAMNTACEGCPHKLCYSTRPRFNSFSRRRLSSMSNRSRLASALSTLPEESQEQPSNHSEGDSTVEHSSVVVTPAFQVGAGGTSQEAEPSAGAGERGSQEAKDEVWFDAMENAGGDIE